MTAAKQSCLLPKLRFAEFLDEPPWERLPLRKLAKRIIQRNFRGANLKALTNSAEHGVVDQREYFDKGIATNTDNYFIVEAGDYVYNPRSSAIAPVGPISKNEIGTGVVSPIYTVFRFRSDDNGFFAHYFRSSHWHGYMRRVSNTGARHDRLSITNDDLMRMPIPTPMLREQRKIADCLDSLDDLITAEGRKIDALRKHKQGLMQQLFPKPGEKVPRMRFPEFRHAAEWETKVLGTQGSFLSSLTGKTAKDFDTGDATFVPYMNVFSNAFTNTADLRSVNVADHESQRAVAKGDVFFTVSSETPEEAGMSSVLLEEIRNCLFELVLHAISV
ncbi:MAG: restriction endonuclease subunit S [Gammaproteobacteria bacterium]|nr:restriction endonuclease subunit S [Gammaproteobacteria bacterium]